MQKFEFSLESALQYRDTHFEMERARLERLYGELQGVNQEADTLIAERNAADLAVKSESSTMALSLFALDSFNRHVSVCKTRLEAKKIDCLNRIQDQQRAVLQARQDRELLARIKQRRQEEWQRGWQKEQDELASELHLARFARESQNRCEPKDQATR